MAWKSSAFRFGSLISEQFAYAISNFAITAILARLLSVEDFAVYASAYSLTMLLTTLHQGGLCDALFVFRKLDGEGPRRLWFRASLAIFIGSIAAAIAGFAVGGLGAVFGIGFAIFAPASLNQYIRRRNQVDQRFYKTLFASILYGALACSTTFMLSHSGFVWAIVVVPQFVGFLGAAAINGFPSKTTVLRANSDNHSAGVKEVVVFSLLLALNNLMGWIPTNIYQWIFLINGNSSDAATFRVIQTMFVPYFQVMAALGGPISQILQSNGLNKKTFYILIGLLLLPLLGAIFLYVFGSYILYILFGANFKDLGSLAAQASALVVPAFAYSLFGTWLRARHMASLILVGSLINIAVLVCVGVPFAASMGLYAVFYTIASSYILAIAILCCILCIRRGKSLRVNQFRSD